MSLLLRYAVRTHVGLVRELNEDSGYAGPYLLVVADGMGGMPAGDLASAIAVRTLAPLDRPPDGDPRPLLARAVAEVAAGIAAHERTEPQVEGMGTTLTAAVFDGASVALAHIGDSRGYLLRGSELRQLTRDHTFVQSLVDEGRITAEQARTHPHRSVILRVVDGRQDAEPDLDVLPLQPGDRLLLCSDGLPASGADPEAVRAALATAGSPDEAADRLIELALRAGASDNVTCVVAEAVDVRPGVEPTDRAFGVAGQVGAAADLPAVLGAGMAGTGAGATTGADGADGAGAAAGADGTGPVDRAGQAAHVDAAGVASDVDDPEALRYAPRPPRRFRWLWRSLVAAVTLAVVAAGLWAAYDWTQRQFFVAAFHQVGDTGDAGYPWQSYDDTDQVAIFRGISQQVPGVRLASVYEVQPLSLGSLPTYQRRMVVRAISADDLRDARAVVAQLQEVAAKCAAAGSAGDTGSDRGGSVSRGGALRGGLAPDQRRTVLHDPQVPLECAGVHTPATGSPTAPQPSGDPTSSAGTPSPTSTGIR